MAKRSYETFYNIIEQNFYSTMEKISVDEYTDIKNYFYRGNFWAEHVVTQLGCWVAFYFKHERFPGSKKLISIPQVKTPHFLKTNIPISLIDLYKNFAGTDAKTLTSIQALAALNIHFGGNKYSSQQVMSEYLKNVTFQALSQENDDVYMSFEEIGLLVNDFLECFVKKENEQIDKSSILGKQIRKKIETDFKVELSPALKIQRGEKEIEPEINDPIESSTPLKTEENRRNLQSRKRRFLKNGINNK